MNASNHSPLANPIGYLASRLLALFCAFECAQAISRVQTQVWRDRWMTGFNTPWEYGAIIHSAAVYLALATVLWMGAHLWGRLLTGGAAWEFSQREAPLKWARVSLFLTSLLLMVLGGLEPLIECLRFMLLLSGHGDFNMRVPNSALVWGVIWMIWPRLLLLVLLPLTKSVARFFLPPALRATA